MPLDTLADLVNQLRTVLCKTFRMFTAHCLSQKRADWAPAILAVTLGTIAASVIMDTAYAISEPVRSRIWPPNIYSACHHIRNGMYAIVVDLMRARADDDSPKGPKPLHLDCWDIEFPNEPRIKSDPTSLTEAIPPHRLPAKKTGQTSEDLSSASSGARRNPAGMALVNHDASAFDVFRNLKLWTQKHHSKLQHTRAWSANLPYSQHQVPPITNVSTVLGF